MEKIDKLDKEDSSKSKADKEIQNYVEKVQQELFAQLEKDKDLEQLKKGLVESDLKPV